MLAGRAVGGVGKGGGRLYSEKVLLVWLEDGFFVFHAVGVKDFLTVDKDAGVGELGGASGGLELGGTKLVSGSASSTVQLG